MKMNQIVNKRQLKTAAKVAAYVGAGAIAAQVGSRAVKSVSPTIAGFAAKSPYNEAGVDLAAGLLAAAAGHFIAKKAKLSGAGGAGALMASGAMLSAFGPLVGAPIADAINGVIDRVLPGGGYMRGAYPGALAGYDVPALPGALAGVDVPRAMAGGAASVDVPFIR